MSWLFEPMKDVAVNEKRRGGDKQPLIRRCPNGGTPSFEDSVPFGMGREPSELKHLSRVRKRNPAKREIPSVAVSESGEA
jgi:hypothetical protein